MKTLNQTPTIETLLALVFKMESVGKELDREVTRTEALFSLTNKEILELLSIKQEL